MGRVRLFRLFLPSHKCTLGLMVNYMFGGTSSTIARLVPIVKGVMRAREHPLARDGSNGVNDVDTVAVSLSVTLPPCVLYP